MNENDSKVIMLDGQPEVMFTARGTILYSYFSWADDKMPKAYEFLQRYCQFLAMNGYGCGAKEIFFELLSKSKDEGADWIKATYDRFVTDPNAIFNFVYGI